MDPRDTAKAIIGIAGPAAPAGPDEAKMSAAREFMKAAQGDPTSANDVETLLHCFKALDEACGEDGEEEK